MDFKLQEGVEGASFLPSFDDNEFFLIGGSKLEDEKSDRIMKYNINNVNDRNKFTKLQNEKLQENRFFHKQFINSHGDIFILGKIK